MSDTKWTKGPWKVFRNDDDGEIIVGMDTYIKSRNHYYIKHRIVVSEDIYQDDKDYDEVVANANLISAAPDLYAALEAVEWVTSVGELDCESYCPACRYLKYAGHAPDCQLNAALKAARGEG